MVKPSSLFPRAMLRAALKSVKRSQHRNFDSQLPQASLVQRRWLQRRIHQCESTTFGRDHGFKDIRNLAEFRRRVPVAGYDYIAPYINAVASGDRWALIPDDDELVQFTITTGSTGVPKLNPVTASWIREYRRGWDIWGTRLFTDHPQHIGSRILQMAGTWDMGRTAAGHQISMVSAVLTRMQSALMKPFYAIPEVLNSISDPVVRHYAALRIGILDDIGWIMLMNPGTLIRLAEIGDQHKELLIRDVYDGTLSAHFEISDSLRSSLAAVIPPPDPKGAAKLEAICNRTGRLLPRDYWNEPVIGCWLGGTAGFPSGYLHEYFGASPLRDMGLVSSEGRHTIPLKDDHAYGVLSFGAGFYEFIPVADANGHDPVALEGHELEVDHDYRILITNSAGYFRFDIGDIVRCRGFSGQSPELEFIQKSNRIGDLEGEKLTEHQVVEAAHIAAGKTGVTLGFITAVPRRLRHEQPRYDFLVESTEIESNLQAEQFLRHLDAELGNLNFLWRARRREGVLQSPHLTRLAPGEWDRCIQEEVKRRGTGDYQYKHPGLVMDESWLEQFRVQDTITFH